MIARGTGWPDRARRRVRLLHRRDLPAEPRRAGSTRRRGDIKFGVQTRIDLWKPEMLDLLGRSRLRLDRGGRREHHAKTAASCSTRSASLRRDEISRAADPCQASACRSCRPTCSTRSEDDPAEVEAWRAASAASTASGRTSPCRCSRIPARPTTRAAGERPTTAPGSARTSITWQLRRVQRHPGTAAVAAACSWRPRDAP